jgi:hypothetical protein
MKLVGAKKQLGDGSDLKAPTPLGNLESVRDIRLSIYCVRRYKRICKIEWHFGGSVYSVAPNVVSVSKNAVRDAQSYTQVLITVTVKTTVHKRVPGLDGHKDRRCCKSFVTGPCPELALVPGDFRLLSSVSTAASGFHPKS